MFFFAWFEHNVGKTGPGSVQLSLIRPTMSTASSNSMPEKNSHTCVDGGGGGAL
jgi:hypothetical protein